MTTQSGKTTIDPSMLVVNEVRNNTININDASKVETKKLVTKTNTS